ncbi:phosphotransferase [Solwaraspora sp. WMMB335]|uniref:phosphotransferase n=1 Tax=Solwaraspora sp. WMMB335 TaxID=3404118 RepID=UPI003B93B315
MSPGADRHRRPENLQAALDAACLRAGYPSGARLIRHFANAVYLLDAVPVVARIGYGPGVVDKARTAINVTRWLLDQGFPATAPTDLPSGEAQPLILGPADAPTVVSFWRYYAQPEHTGWPDTRILGRLAAALHQVPDNPPSLPQYQPLRTLTSTVQAPAARQALTDDEHTWLTRRIKELRDEYHGLQFPLGHGLIHADLYTGNLLWNAGPHRAVLGDWDSVSIGPLEIDLIPTYAETRFGVDPATVDAFAHAYGHDLRHWPGYDTLYNIRELSTLTALIRLAPGNPRLRGELAHRLNTLSRADRSTRWQGQ